MQVMGTGRCVLHNIHARQVPPFDLNMPIAVVRRLRSLHSRIEDKASARLFLSNGYLAPTLNALQHSHDVSVQFHAAWALTNLASVEDYDNGGIAIVDAGGVPILLRYAERPFVDDMRVNEVSAQALWCLGNLAGSGDAVRLDVLEAVFQREWPIETFPAARLRQFIFLFQNLAFAGSTANGVQLDALGARVLLRTADEAVPPAVFRDALYGFLRLYERSTVASPEAIHCIIGLLDHMSSSVRGLALRYIGDVLSGHNARAIDACLSEGITVVFHRMLHSGGNHDRDIFWNLSNLAVEPLGTMMIVETPGLLTTIVENCAVQPEAVWTASNLAHRGSPDILEGLCAAQVHIALHEAMQHTEDLTVAAEGLAAMLIRGDSLRIRADLALPDTFQIVVTADEPAGSISETAAVLRARR